METSTAPYSPAHSCPLSSFSLLMRVFIAVCFGSCVAVPSAMAQSRGELLYTTHCIACHTTEMHWRDKRSATNWPSLKDQVRRWQDAASLAWTESAILDVSRYLNETIYRFEQTADQLSSSGRDHTQDVRR